jgi:hypothetical protein
MHLKYFKDMNIQRRTGEEHRAKKSENRLK